MNNRENLLKQAMEMFASRGYEAVGVQEIADAAGIKKPTLYHYFGSKSGLLGTLLTEHFDPFFETLQAAATYKGDVTGTLRDVVRAYFSFAGQNPRLYRFYLSMWFAPTQSDGFKVTASLNERQQQLIETLFASAANDHGNMKGRQRTYAASFLGMVNTYVMLSLNGYAEFNDELVYSLVHQFMHGIFS
jgi:TetR/AcrR family transcriptional regulator